MGLTEVTPPSVAYMCLGGFVVAFSMISLLAREKIFVNEVVVGTLFGIFMGPYFANIFNPRDWGSSNTITLEVMRIVLATGLFAIGVELPKSYMWKHAKSLLTMVVPTMAIGWLIVAGILSALFPKLNFVSCLAISACLTPTDPIVCAAIVGGRFAQKHVPLNIRQILSAESAANDGLAYPFISLALYLTIDGTRGAAFKHWVLIGWLYQVILGIVIGAVLGLLFSGLMKRSHDRGFIDRESYVAQFLALAVFITGVVSTLGSDDLLATFAAGSAISWDGHFNTHVEGEVFASVIDLLLNCGCFIYIGAWIPFNAFTIPELSVTPSKLVALAVAIMFLRRIPAILLLYKWIPEISSWQEALFCGHFGPMGVGAVFVSSLAIHRLSESADSADETQKDLLILALQPIVAFIVLASIIIHGLSIPFFNMGRNVSRTVSLTATLTNPTRSYPEWLMGTSRNPTLPQQQPTEPSSSPEDKRHVEHNSFTEAISIDMEDSPVALETPIPTPSASRPSLSILQHPAPSPSQDVVSEHDLAGPSKKVHFPSSDAEED
ncbi:Sodium/hydrogen exchanger family-domain-containing protein [Crepidotus variabilis]|uniref:Sodium/hydrogen exchanger family-domain-containing protein n=1 Tax=Crepidotus variabilis TaxID=179855 RepID=A0A9P6EKR9_9AGAR|nr:Sodium/hydrogen exchanger family-domain-containing protein [Crepidotus variabilis]